MAISIQIGPIIRPFRGFTDAALPDGFWVAHGAVLGDVSGGLMSVNIRFSASAQPASSLLWSMDQLIVDHTSGSVRDFRIDFGGFDLQPIQGSTGSLTKIIHFQIEDLGSAVPGSAMSISDTIRHIFLGSPRKDVNVDLSFDTDNVDANSFSVFVQGFFWGPAAINAPGGPQRPLTSLYSQ